MFSLIIAFGLIVLSAFYDTEEKNMEITETVYISALKDDSSIKGDFFLGTGTVEGDQYYYYIAESEKGKKMDKVSSTGDVYIKESNNERPRIETHLYESKFISKFARFMYGETSLLNDYEEKIIYIPEDSVTTEFNVDME